ncbi:hypothetical protein PKHYL_21950 [Psychrobacter sp. KH172YL61]|uniref:hypothetical protein n=1 Tax=Psychrobacter sp. KH172YL61 TaxID=2517899 RepID=UPI0010B536D7|nr:hypothetical protein [Psychrobacter sp. KH172YL61]BBI68004.1 hypothetical protein PKHYL_21950 [Psychrobacter sp. KH172YL61]
MDSSTAPEKDRLQTARYARYDYEDGRLETDYSSDEYDNRYDAESIDESRIGDAKDDNEK